MIENENSKEKFLLFSFIFKLIFRTVVQIKQIKNI